MILPFKTKFDNGEPTYFPEKIYFSICKEVATGNNSELSEKLVMFFNDGGSSMVKKDFWHKEYFENLTQGKPHTIRADEKNRWKPGNKIHFYINNRKPDMTLFAPVLKVTGVQKIWIDPVGIEVDDKLVDEELVARNDGFRDFKHMLEFFPETFTGKIIHWTDLSY